MYGYEKFSGERTLSPIGPANEARLRQAAAACAAAAQELREALAACAAATLRPNTIITISLFPFDLRPNESDNAESIANIARRLSEDDEVGVAMDGRTLFACIQPEAHGADDGALIEIQPAQLQRSADAAASGPTRATDRTDAAWNTSRLYPSTPEPRKAAAGI